MAPSPDDSNPRPKKRTKYDFFQGITVLIGPEETKFVLHKDLATKNSEFFRTACSGDWKEASEGLVRLPEADFHAFGVYVGWLYTGEIDLSPDKDNASMPNYDKDLNGSRLHVIYLELVNCFCLGDMLLDNGFCNAAIDEYIRFYEGTKLHPSLSTIHKMWSKLPKNSTMAKLLVDYIATDLKIELFLKHVDEYPTDFMVKIATVCVRDGDMMKQDRIPRNRAKCFYHEHKNDDDKCS